MMGKAAKESKREAKDASHYKNRQQLLQGEPLTPRKLSKATLKQVVDMLRRRWKLYTDFHELDSVDALRSEDAGLYKSFIEWMLDTYNIGALSTLVTDWKFFCRFYFSACGVELGSKCGDEIWNVSTPPSTYFGNPLTFL